MLIIDDDEDTLEVVFEMLDGAGYEVVLAHDGREAMELLINGLRPAVIMLDVMMPKANGNTFRIWQRARPELARIPVLVATAAPLSKNALEELSPDGQLDKPFDFRTLKDAVQSLIDRPRPSPGATP
ncbi:MAG TPA: response regulator [Kofleriaceae bacterium]|nr:response regulator [Kofleriaceae bacterium]